MTELPNNPLNKSAFALNASSLEQFYLSLFGLSAQEISKAKLLYLETAIDGYQASLKWNQMFKIQHLNKNWVKS